MSYGRGSVYAALLTAPLVLPATVEAADKSGAFAVKGVGNEGCEQFMAAYKEKKQGVLLFESWLDGYLTSLNTFTANIYDVAPWHGGPMLLYLATNFCTNNPNGKLFEAAAAIRNFIRPFQLATSSPAVEAKVGDKTLKLYKETLRQAQELLIKAGHLQGKADGGWGAKSQAAFEEYQKKHNLKQTGLPDQETLLLLFYQGQQQQQQSGGQPAPAGAAPKPAGTTAGRPAAQPAKPAATQQAVPPKLDLNLGGSPPPKQ